MEIITDGHKHDEGKLRPSLLDTHFVKGVLSVLEFGAKKYSKNGWREIPDAHNRYLDALERHVMAYKEGEEFDPDSGLRHLDHIATNVYFLRHFDLEENNEQTTRSFGITRGD